MRGLIAENDLPLHALLLIKPKRNYTYDLTPVLKQLAKMSPNTANENQPGNQDERGRPKKVEELTVFETIKNNLKDTAIY